jgi:NADH:ubiquinone oxidoreductase subunit 5 (subunit L)/multisubunit Na+/H+ antiporter MnhA subunit
MVFLVSSISLADHVAGVSVQIAEIVAPTDDFDDLLGIAIAISENSPWNSLVIAIMSSVAGLWIFSNYLEFDKGFTKFLLTLVAFLLTVWLVVGNAGSGNMFLLIFGWELVGLVSFCLISTWFARSLTFSSSLSAIGFNRIGDVVLAGIVATAGLWNVGLFADSSPVTSLGLGILTVSIFKSVIGISWLWLPEAMEGPTPVSALLHSCTLVMAGIFVVFAIPSQTTGLGSAGAWALFLTFSMSLLLVSLAPVAEKDAKRAVAGSTVVMVGLIFLILVTSFGSTAFLIALFHASYKSALFVAVGRMLGIASIYADNVAVSTAIRNPVILILLFLIGAKTTAYGSCKHAIDAFVVDSADISLCLLSGFGFVLVWCLGLRYFHNFRRLASATLLNLPVFVMFAALTLLGFTTFSGQPASYGYGNVTSLLLLIWLPFATSFGIDCSIRSYRLTFFNIGTLAWSADVSGIYSSRYPAFRVLSGAGSVLAAVGATSQAGILVGAVAISAVSTVLLLADNFKIKSSLRKVQATPLQGIMTRILFCTDP